MRYFSVKNFDEFQHYKDRSPPWIKLYNTLLDDYDFASLPDASKAHLLAIWLLASRSSNRLPYDSQWISNKVNATESVDLDALAAAGFILIDQPLQGVEHVASAPLAECLPREETEERRDRGETEKRERGAKRATRAPEGWEPNPETLKALQAERPEIDVSAEVPKYRDWSASSPKGLKLDHDAAFRNWVRRVDPLTLPKFLDKRSGTTKSLGQLHDA